MFISSKIPRYRADVNTLKIKIHVSVTVYYVAVRTIVLSRQGSNLARPVIIHDIIHSLMCMPSTPHCRFSGVSPDAPTSIEVFLRPTQSQSDEPSDLRGSLSPTTRHRCTMSLCIRHVAVPGGHPSNYEPCATFFNLSDECNGRI